MEQARPVPRDFMGEQGRSREQLYVSNDCASGQPNSLTMIVLIKNTIILGSDCDIIIGDRINLVLIHLIPSRMPPKLQHSRV